MSIESRQATRPFYSFAVNPMRNHFDVNPIQLERFTAGYPESVSGNLNKNAIHNFEKIVQ